MIIQKIIIIILKNILITQKIIRLKTLILKEKKLNLYALEKKKI